jgi:hypothetical protein
MKDKQFSLYLREKEIFPLAIIAMKNTTIDK